MAPPPDAELVAAMIQLGQQLQGIEDRSKVIGDPEFPDWYRQQGGAHWIAAITGHSIPTLGVFLMLLAARKRPGWLDQAAVDLADPLAGGAAGAGATGQAHPPMSWAHPGPPGMQ